jgi:hypothetical protein
MYVTAKRLRVEQKDKDATTLQLQYNYLARIENDNSKLDSMWFEEPTEA